MNNELYHHGILGQKWGVRRFQNKDGSLTSAGRNRAKQADSNNVIREAKRQKVRDLKNKRNMSDAELANKIRRLQMEKQLRELTESEVAPGRTLAKNILIDIGKRTIATAATGAILYAGKAAVSGQFNKSEMADAIFRGGAKKK